MKTKSIVLVLTVLGSLERLECTDPDSSPGPAPQSNVIPESASTPVVQTYRETSKEVTPAPATLAVESVVVSEVPGPK